MTEQKPTIIYTLAEEAPLFATYSLLPIIGYFLESVDICIKTINISVAYRILAEFDDFLPREKHVLNNLHNLSYLTKLPNTSIIKLPNISASVPQLKTAIKELQISGYAVPNYYEKINTEEKKIIKKRYQSILGSVINPILREGNSNRLIPKVIKEYTRKNPHYMDKWSHTSCTHIATMKHGDFFHREKSLTFDKACDVRMELITSSSTVITLKNSIKLNFGDIIDSMYMDKKELVLFYEKQINDAYQTNLLFSLHLKCTMMKVSHPIIFGYAIKTYYKYAFDKHQALINELDINVNNGLVDLYSKLEKLPSIKKEEFIKNLNYCHTFRPDLAMADSRKNISNFSIPSNIIIDASIPTMIRYGGRMWDLQGKARDTKAVIPDSTFARIYQEVLNFCKIHGQFNPTKMGTLQNVGLMAQKAEEYGSHDRTFEINNSGYVKIIDNNDGKIVLFHKVEKGDIWCVPTVKDSAIREWVKLSISRASSANIPLVFWLDNSRPHEREICEKIKNYLYVENIASLDIKILPQVLAMRYTLERISHGQDTIAVTGNILRDYLTDLFPILELGTSAKMLSIVPLISGGNLYETGSGGSAPKHVEQLIKENHLRWDSLGEFFALNASLKDLSNKLSNKKIKILAQSLDVAIAKILDNNKSPSNLVGELDSRHTHFYLALYWSQAISEQKLDNILAKKFTFLYKKLISSKKIIICELNSSQGIFIDIGGYYYPDIKKTYDLMRPSRTLNKIFIEFNSI